MECLYFRCGHNSTDNNCKFLKLPTDECKLKIWKRYAKFTGKDIKNIYESRLCSCHFKDSSYPIPIFSRETKRKSEKLEDYSLEVPTKKLFKDQIENSDQTNNSVIICDDNSYVFDSTIEYLSDDVGNLKLESKNAANVFTEETVSSAVDHGFDEMFSMDDDLFQINTKTKLKASSTLDSDCYYLIEIEPTPTPVSEPTSHHVSEINNRKLLMCKANTRQHTEADYRKIEVENEKLKTEIERLNNRLINMNLAFEFKFIENSDEKVFLHTGLPSKDIFNLVFDIMDRFNFDYVMNWNVRTIPKKTQFLMTLIKLRMDLRYFDICQRFGFSEATVSNIFRTWILAMHEILFLQLMEKIPSRFKNQECLPASFNDFIDCRIILDCTEMNIDKPNKMDNQRAVFSSYKHHVTTKALTGVAPNGVMTYSSKLYPGSLSDKKIFQHCGVRDQFDVGDSLLADKGFLIRDDLPYGVNLNLPPFLTTPQFTRQQVRLTEIAAKSRVHVERSINRVKNFRILHYIPAEFFPIANEIFQVCVALSNFQYPLIREIASDL